jgi:hypothetical protein
MVVEVIMKQRLIHTGNLSYLNKVHRGYGGIHRYWMKLLKQWSDGKMTVEFMEKEDETKT